MKCGWISTPFDPFERVSAQGDYFDPATIGVIPWDQLPGKSKRRMHLPFIRHWLPPTADFDPAALAVMGEAYERALASFASFPSRPIREAIAAKIIALATADLLDPVGLCEQALAASGLRSRCDKQRA